VNQARWSVLFLTVGALLFTVGLVPCRAQTGSPTNLSDGAHQSPSDPPAAMTPEIPPISEIVVPPLPDAFTKSSNPDVRKAAERVEEIFAFKDLDFDPSAVFGERDSDVSSKSSAISVGVIPPRAGCVEFSPSDWVPDCAPVVRPGVLSCRFYRYNGSLCVEWFDDRTPLTWMVEIRMDGTTGSATFENFVVQRWASNTDHKWAGYEHRQHIEHPDLEGGYADGPQDEWEFMVEGEATLYTPNGKTDLSTRHLTHRHHQYDFNDREFFMLFKSTLSCFPDGGFRSVLYCANLKTKELYVCYVAYWKEDKGGWMTFDEDGRLTASGEFE